ncbi:unnamed protein product [Lepeophtheirus salmonis]|uniref:(salmon louse) hypothetical protein n=1 Tax=Lepeophtheirus salmonis TaxID=72036 RepID=A0A7R8D0K5_LEPSM|nr:unnamed protein product [Lepeophtheirus salmonis]CAF2960005.1 unnamed protein product [Lepeophtheirus salmonis]
MYGKRGFLRFGERRCWANPSTLLREKEGRICVCVILEQVAGIAAGECDARVAILTNNIIFINWAIPSDGKGGGREFIVVETNKGKAEIDNFAFFKTQNGQDTSTQLHATSSLLCKLIQYDLG